MDPIYILTGLFTVVAAIAGLAITCHLERRALSSRRGRNGKQAAVGTAKGPTIAA